MNPEELPVYRHRGRILEALKENQVVVVESPTGSGKTTQLPLILYESQFNDHGIIGVTQPRRIAAVSVSTYIGNQIGSKIPGIVGYKMRFDDKTDPSTRIKIMTDGTLLQELKLDPLLTSYSVIMIDEAHERSLNIDFILGLLKRIIRERSKFRVIVSSATINAELFSEYFDECPVVRIDAKTYPVETRYAPLSKEGDEEELISRVASIVRSIDASPDPGDVLVFLTGEKQIKSCASSLADVGSSLYVLPLYGRLSKEEQDRVFDPPPRGTRKVVIATNIAETSITIDGIRWVIDSGMAKINHYDPKTFTSSLVESWISRASCNQRRGRAGRTAPGVCYRLYAKKNYETRSMFELEEIRRTDLSEVVLRMSELGIYDFETFDFLSPPGPGDIHGAVETLRYLEALNDDRSLSNIGTMMAQFPLLPRQSRIIVAAIHAYPETIGEAIIAAAFLSAHSPLLLPRGEEMEARRRHHKFRSDDGDFVSFLILLNAFRTAADQGAFCRNNYLDPRVMGEIDNIVVQLQEIVARMNIPLTSGGSVRDYLCAVATGLVQFVCIRDGRREYRSATAERISIHPGSVMFQKNPEFIVAGEIVKTSRVFARSVSPLERSWLPGISKILSKITISPIPQRANSTRKDSTWRIELGPETFELRPYKGRKKIVILPWKRLRPLIRKELVSEWMAAKDLRGTVMFKDYELFSGYRLRKILRLLEHVDPDRDFDPRQVPMENMSYPRDRDALVAALGRVGKLAPFGEAKRSGFITLHTDGEIFWQRVSNGSTHASSESISSIDVLADRVASDEEFERAANTAYRRLAALLED